MPIAVARAEHAADGPDRPFDEADWVEWDHWQAEQELQDLVDGLADDSRDEHDGRLTDPGQDSNWFDALSRRLRRHGVEIAE